jgi:DUF971 family protein
MQQPKPERIEVFPNDELGVAWSDGREDYIPARTLRLACPCAACVDEMTGRRTLDPARVPADVRIERWEPVGHYAIGIVWSDGHTTGIYSNTLLRQVGDALREGDPGTEGG